MYNGRISLILQWVVSNNSIFPIDLTGAATNKAAESYAQEILNKTF